jgi:hypothetical protein
VSAICDVYKDTGKKKNLLHSCLPEHIERFNASAEGKLQALQIEQDEEIEEVQLSHNKIKK